MDTLRGSFISYGLIWLSCIISIIVWKNRSLFRYGFHPEFFARGEYVEWMKQLFLFQFIHGDILHLVLNSYFLYQAGPILEHILFEPLFLVFFFLSTVISAIALYMFAPKSNTVGISGFCMAILSYLWLHLTAMDASWASQIGTLLVINILLGLAPGISLVGHISGAIAGVIFWFMTSSIL